MGHTLSQWQVKIRSIVRDASRRDVPTDWIETAGLRPAFSRYSSDRPNELVVEVAGASSAYFDLPAGWVDGLSILKRVEYPARQNPPQWLDDQAWLQVRSPSDVTVKQILLDEVAAANTFVRFCFTADWPYPTNAVDGGGNAVIDQTDGRAFEAVSALAASLIITGLDFAASQRRAELAADPNSKPVAGTPDQSLLATAKAYEAIYLRFLGIDPDTPGTTTVAPAGVTLDFDPQYDSLFHGGRR